MFKLEQDLCLNLRGETNLERWMEYNAKEKLSFDTKCDVKLKGINSHLKDWKETSLELTALYMNSMESKSKSELKDRSKPETWM